MTPLETFLIETADGAGKILIKYFNKTRHVRWKRGAGIVTEADGASEKYILKNIFRKFPKSSIITEESGEYPGDSLCWVIDPLDGTSNYAHGFPYFCVSIGVRDQGVLRAGVVYNPLLREMFVAETGKGTKLNGRRIRVSTNSEMRSALLGTGFYYSKGNRLREETEIFRRVNEKTLAVRRPGAAALDLAYVACGRYDGFWERGLSAWDVAAGWVLIAEAGGRISGYDGKPTDIFARNIVASNGAIHKRLFNAIRGRQ